ncbi:MAG: SBBP repeat-containing protein [Bacteroidetes bacterium]|nr:SBBP repeat-containing protein [Bacteroidota bacterium]
MLAIGNQKPNGAAIARQYLTNKPVRFTENKGQITDMEGKSVPFVLFKIDAPSLEMYITSKGITYMFLKMEEKDKENAKKKEGSEENRRMEWNRIDMYLNGASIKTENIIKEGRSMDFAQYFSGQCPDGITDIHSFEKITIKEIYPGIDWLLYNSDSKGFKYDFIVHPGGKPKDIQIVYNSKRPVKLNRNGELIISADLGTITENAPSSFFNGQLVGSKYKLSSSKKNNLGGYTSTVGIDFSATMQIFFESSDIAYPTTDLIIDPQLTWGTFYGANGGNGNDGPLSVTTDSNGNVFVTGYTGSTNFPTLNSGTYFQGTNASGSVGDLDGFILKFKNTGTLLWATYYGGSAAEFNNSIVTDGNNNVFVTGQTFSTDFPLQNSGTFFQGTFGGTCDAFILKFNNNGNRIWSTYYGGTGFDSGTSIVADGNNNIFLSGNTRSTDFPVMNTGNFFQGVNAGGMDLFILKLNNSGNQIWASYYGGSLNDFGNSITSDGIGNVIITGYTQSNNFPTLNAGTFFQTANSGSTDIIILKFDNFCNRLWATYYGGTGDDYGYSIASDANNNLFVTGQTQSANFPVQNGGAFFQATNAGGIGDIFILKFDNVSNRIWATYYGGSGNEAQYSNDNLAIDPCGFVYLSFQTSSLINITQPSCDGGYFDNSYNGGTWDQFIVRFSNTGVRLWASYLGGDGSDFRSPIAVDNSGNLFVSGEWSTITNNATYPLPNPGGGAYYDGTFNGTAPDDGFMVKFNSITGTSTSSFVNSTSCNPCNGSATISLNNICAPFTYLWSNGLTQSTTTNTTSNITGLCPGNYTVTVTSNCNQTLTATFAIAGNACGGITVTASSSDICKNGCATVTSTVTNGTGPYTYTWSNGATTQNISPCPVSATTYTVTITDNTGLTATSTASVTINPAVTVTVTSTNLTCNGSNGGSAQATGSTGTSPFTYNWSNGISNSLISNLTSQIYTVTVTDNKGCTGTSSVTIAAPPALSGQFSKGTANCMGCGCKEWIMVTASGGTEPYSYSWSASGGIVNRYKNQLCPGTYTINIKDKNGCSINISLTTP